MASAYTDGNPAAGTLGSYDEEASTVQWLSKALMTVTESGSLYCGGAHPDNHFEPYTFDLLRGEYLDWNRVLDAYRARRWPPPRPTPRATRKTIHWMAARTYGPAIWPWARNRRAC
ncbi:hypothetical protein G6F59_017667 [Rhizopus arrhizus]|nr:hypothetical protein G6F59_017667 [Rhizopus arrhizus]